MDPNPSRPTPPGDAPTAGAALEWPAEEWPQTIAGAALLVLGGVRSSLAPELRAVALVGGGALLYGVGRRTGLLDRWAASLSEALAARVSGAEAPVAPAHSVPPTPVRPVSAEQPEPPLSRSTTRNAPAPSIEPSEPGGAVGSAAEDEQAEGQKKLSTAYPLMPPHIE